MKIAVITPYYKESLEVLRQCHESVAMQETQVDHFLIADGHPNDAVSKWNAKHIILSDSHGDNGNTPRGIGSLLAQAEGYDFIAFLDADNWFYPNHITSLLDLYQKTKAEVCTSLRSIHDLDGIKLDIEELNDLSLKHIDTSCFMLHQNAFAVLDIWLKMPKELSPICDKIFLAAIKNKRYRIATTKQKSVGFRSQYKEHYVAANIEPPLNFKEDVQVEPIQWLRTLTGVKETVEKLGFYPA